METTEINKIEHHLALLIAEAEALLPLLAVVDAAQWEASPAGMIEREVRVADTSGAINDPTGAIVTDPARLAIRTQVQRSERLVKDALVKVAGVRRGLEVAMSRWETGV
jgi:hypothetical protein